MEYIYFKNREEWHQWLVENHEKASEVWLLYYKKHTGKPTISYEDAVLEALAFGWIDSTVRRIDDEKHMQRFTPRRKGSVWSESNFKRIKLLIAEGKMTKAGLRAAEPVLSGTVKPVPGSIKDCEMPELLKQELAKDPEAKKNFERFPASSKKIFYFWIENAKGEETKLKRLDKTIKAAKENNKFGYM